MKGTAAGYSLLETCVCLAILGVLISIPVQRSSSDRKLLRLHALQIEEIVERARAAAQLTRTRHRVIIEPDLLTLETDESMVEQVQLPGDLHVSSRPEILAFTQSGTASPGRIALRLRENICFITISLFGRSTLRCT